MNMKQLKCEQNVNSACSSVVKVCHFTPMKYHIVEKDFYFDYNNGSLDYVNVIK